MFNRQSSLTPPPRHRWKAPEILSRIFDDRLTLGGFVDHVAIRLGEFTIPPSEIPQILPQQLLMLKVSAGAMRDAGLVERQSREHMGAIIGIAYDFEATIFTIAGHCRNCCDGIAEITAVRPTRSGIVNGCTMPETVAGLP
jgi:hypothetical protein